MKIALLRLPATYADWYQNPTLGISYICSCLEQSGYDCQIFNAYFRSWSDEEIQKYVMEYKPDVIGLSAMTHEISHAAQVAEYLKNKLNVPVVVGGCHITALPEQTLAEFSAFDYGIYGEGEKTFMELLEHFQQGSASYLSEIDGLVFRRHGQVVVNKPRPFLTSEELDTLPYPAYHQHYGKNTNALSGKQSYYTMITSRGCPYNCAFCMQVLGRKVRRRSHQSICDEVKFAISSYDAHTINFADEVFLFNNDNTRQLLQFMIDQGLPEKIRWTGLIRANYVQKDLIDLAKRAGCCRLSMGVESGDSEILKIIDKGITLEQVENAVRIIKDAKVRLSTYFILGHPNETRETVKKTVDLAVKLNTNTIAVGLMVPYPGTRIYDMAQRGEGGYRLLAKDWSDYDKYYCKALEIEGLPHDELVKWQRLALIKFYLKNLRLFDAIMYLWERRRIFKFLFSKYIIRNKMAQKDI